MAAATADDLGRHVGGVNSGLRGWILFDRPLMVAPGRPQSVRWGREPEPGSTNQCAMQVSRSHKQRSGAGYSANRLTGPAGAVRGS